MSASLNVPPAFTRRQRWVALGYGLVCHILFVASLASMGLGLYSGLRLGILHLHGFAALLANLFLLGQFAITHSLLLTTRGRSFMARLAPMGLGRPLSTTIFAAIASTQLLATFLLWSPTGTVWAAPDGWVKMALTTLYIASWILLAKSMHDAGLDVQLGTLGWMAVWSGKEPTYRNFARGGLFRYSRQPIYLSFALVLWTGPVWTADHFFIAVLWTVYCVVAPLRKEKRYLQYYGEAFARYQQHVPYWLPRLRRRVMSRTPIQTSLPGDAQQDPTAPPAGGAAATVAPVNRPPAAPRDFDCDVAIVGAGPVGLLLANLLGAAGWRVQVVEKRAEAPGHSQAIGITPPSLQILAKLGLDAAFVGEGLPIRDVMVHGGGDRLGCCSFRSIPGPYPFVLSLPQQKNIALLQASLIHFSTVTLRRGVEVIGVSQDATHATLQTQEDRITARYVIACDGHRSRVREMVRARVTTRHYRCHFVMGDFVDHGGMKEDAHVFFTPGGAVEAFPMPGGLRRWIVQTDAPMERTSPGYIGELVRQRTGIILPTANQMNQTWFTPKRVDCDAYHEGRVILCGDAAHVMSPIGGQGMNVGFADADHLARSLISILSGEEKDSVRALAAYDARRRQAATTAANRAAAGMWLGTWTGGVKSTVREWLLREVLLHGVLAEKLPRHYAMMRLDG